VEEGACEGGVLRTVHPASDTAQSPYPSYPYPYIHNTRQTGAREGYIRSPRRREDSGGWGSLLPHDTPDSIVVTHLAAGVCRSGSLSRRIPAGEGYQGLGERGCPAARVSSSGLPGVLGRLESSGVYDTRPYDGWMYGYMYVWMDVLMRAGRATMDDITWASQPPFRLLGVMIA